LSPEKDSFLPKGIICIFEEILTMTHLVLLLLGSLGTTEIILILLIVVLMFGGRKIPELMRGLGKGIREFNDAKNNVKREIEDGIKEDPSDRNSR
jgi:sec-independent protein translocase protein TatA